MVKDKQKRQAAKGRQEGRQGWQGKARQGKARQGKAAREGRPGGRQPEQVRSRGLLGPIMGDASGVSLAPISAYPRRNEIRPDWQYSKLKLNPPTGVSNGVFEIEPLGI